MIRLNQNTEKHKPSIENIFMISQIFREENTIIDEIEDNNSKVGIQKMSTYIFVGNAMNFEGNIKTCIKMIF